MSVLDIAQRMAADRLRLVPIGAGTKYPPIPRWQHAATDDLDTIVGWYSLNPEWGLGWKMGLQADDRWLFAIDVDVAKGGKEAMEALVREFGLRGAISSTTTARTGGGGFHFVFELAPEDADLRSVIVNRSKLRPGIDVRAEGGQIVVEPSVHPDTGVVYAWAALKAPWECRPLVADGGVLRMMRTLLTPPAIPSLAPRRPQEPLNGFGGTQTPADWVRDHLDFSTFLVKHGWVHVGGEFWRRPGKSDSGHSASLKNAGAGPLNVFSTDIPPILEALGKLDASGQARSFTLFNFIAAYEFGGDTSACSSWVRRTYMGDADRQVRRLTVDSAPEDGQALGAVGDTVAVLNLPAEFWESRVWLLHIRDAAWSMGMSPDALLMAWLAWYAVLIPPAVRIPAMVGDEATFDLITAIVGRTGDGKSSMIRRAATLTPAPLSRQDLQTNLGLGSGEGFIDAFFGMVAPDPEKPRVKEKRQVFNGCHFAVDEAKLMAELSGRAGTTHISTLCSAWSGSTLSTTNASEERKRHLLAGRYRLTLTLGIQFEFTDDLMSPTQTAQGFVGRLLFGHADDPSLPDPDHQPEWPGVLDVAIPPSTPRILTYDPAIVKDVKWNAYQRRRATTRDPMDAHRDLMRAKLAGIAALVEGRFLVDLQDWTLATAIWDATALLRNHLRSFQSRLRYDRRHSAYDLTVEKETYVEDEKERRAIGRTVDRILLVLSDGPLSPGHLAARLTIGQRRHRDAALAHLDQMGKVKLEGERWGLTV